MLRLTTELDPFDVAVIKDGCVMGHIPMTVSQTVSFFLEKDGSIGYCEVIGAMVNRAAGFGLEIVCVCISFMEVWPT